MTTSSALRETWVEIDLAAFKQNVGELKRYLDKNCLFLAAVKANGYGHGDIAVSVAALEAGADVLGVATVEEGIRLRDAGISAPILVMSPTLPAHAPAILAHDLKAAVTDMEMVRRLGGKQAQVHLKVNTGMNRSGIAVEDVPDFLSRTKGEGGVEVEGIFTHLACADSPDRHDAYDQFDRFSELLRKLIEMDLRPPIAHIANSAALLDMPEMALDMVRPGISLYGLYPSAYVSRRERIKPVLSWKARVVETRRIEAGEKVSYGYTWIAERPTNIALLPVGYGDGFRRGLSNRGAVLIGGRRCPVAGRVCMDLSVVDCGDLPVEVGDEAVIIGTQGDDAVTADEMAELLDTINYEITTQITERVPRVYV